MRNTFTIAQREIYAYFVSPIAYIVTAAFLVIGGYLFSMILYFSREATMRFIFGNLSFIFLLIAPMLTMRLLAEEHRSGTIELLLTSPVRDWEVVLGKFLASLTLFLAMISLTLVYPLVLFAFGHPDGGPILSGYLGLILAGAGYLSVGVFTSSLSRNQIVAAVLGIVLLLVLWLADAAGSFMGGSLSSILSYLSLSSHTSDLTRGVIDTKDVIYYLSLVVAFLFLSVRSLESRRWS
ncbi:MAG: ABC transporter permease subunit [Chloroflexi bacterium]|nr:ABC transporter permease subunit [Chloroflexota bacterium]